MASVPGRTRTFSAFRHPNFRRYWWGAVASMVGTWVQSTAQSFFVWELTHSPLATSLSMFFFGVPTMALSLFGGVLADRVDRRRLLIATQTLFMLQAATLGTLTWLRLVQVWHIYLLSFLGGITMAADSPARQSLVPRLVAREDLTNAIALNALVFNGSRIVGPPIGGLLYAAAGPATAFFANAASYLAVIYPLAVMRLSPQEETAATGVWANLREGLTYVWREPIVRTLLLLVALLGTFAFSYVVLMPVMATTVLHGGAKENGYLLGLVGIGSTSGALLVASAGAGERPGERILTLGALGAAALLGFAFSRDLALSGAILFVVGLSFIGFLATANATIQSLVPDALRGRVMSVYALALIGSGPLNSLLAGILGNTLGAPRAIAVSALCVLVPVVALAFRGRALRSFAPSS
jgi:MFS family permease